MKRAIFCLCKSHSNLFLEPTSTKQWESSFLLKETTGAFDGARTHDWQVSTDNESVNTCIVEIVDQLAGKQSKVQVLQKLIFLYQIDSYLCVF